MTGHYLTTVPAGCTCHYTSHRDPAEPQMGSWLEGEQAEDCPVHPLPEPGPWEPGTVDLTQLARYVVLLQDDPALRHTTGHAVLGAFTELLLAPDDETALTYARRLSDAADADGTRVTAHIPAF